MTLYNTIDELLQGHDVQELLKKAEYLKTTDAEGWVAGELLELVLKRRGYVNPALTGGKA